MNKTNIVTGLYIPSQIPLDSKMFVENEAILTDPNTLATRVATYYKGLQIKCLETLEVYEWKPVLDYEQDSLLNQPYKYPSNWFSDDGVDYSNSEYNFYKIKNLKLSEVEALIPEIPDFPEIPSYSMSNLGGGVEILKNPESRDWELRTLTSDNLMISIENEVIKINQPQAEGGLKQFYVNARYTGALEEGTPTKPYKKLAEVLTKIIGEGDTGSPDVTNVEVILQSDILVTQEDFNNNPKLNGKLSVNSVHITSDDSINLREIRVYSAEDYLVDTNYLINKVGLNQFGNLAKEVKISYSNIRLINYGSLGIIRHKSFKHVSDESRSDSIMTLTNCKFFCYKSDNRYTQVFNRDGSPLIIFGNPVYAQNSIPLTTPHCLVEGWNGLGSSNFNNSNIKITGRSQTVLKTVNCAVEFNNFDVSVDTYYQNYTQGETAFDFLPKSDYYRVIFDSTYTRGTITSLTHSSAFEDNSYIGGDNAFLKVLRTPGIGAFTFNSLEFKLYGMCVNYFVEVDSYETNLSLNNSNFAVLTIKQGFGKTDPARTNSLVIDCNNSILNNVKSQLDTKITYTAAQAVINKAQFTSSPNYASDSAALQGGLITGNIYYNTTTNSLKKIL